MPIFPSIPARRSIIACVIIFRHPLFLPSCLLRDQIFRIFSNRLVLPIWKKLVLSVLLISPVSSSVFRIISFSKLLFCCRNEFPWTLFWFSWKAALPNREFDILCHDRFGRLTECMPFLSHFPVHGYCRANHRFPFFLMHPD